MQEVITVDHLGRGLRQQTRGRLYQTKGRSYVLHSAQH